MLLQPSMFMTASATIIGILGALHFIFTFSGPKLLPRDRALKEAMSKVHPVITGQTNIWRMWIGFNASHSLGAILFGLVYGYLAQVHSEVLFGSVFLLGVGFVMLLSFTILAKLYWFITPFIGSLVALVLYCVSVGLSL